jgi:hypothetical protein
MGKDRLGPARKHGDGARPVERMRDPFEDRGFGQLRPLRRETARIQRVIDREFEVVEPEDHGVVLDCAAKPGKPRPSWAGGFMRWF